MIRRVKKTDKLSLFMFLNNEVPNFNVLFNQIIKNNKIAYVSDEGSEINGFLVVNEKYITMVSSNKVAYNLVSVLLWNNKQEFFANIKLSNKAGFELKRLGFRIIDKTKDIIKLHFNPIEKGKRYGKRNNSKYNNNTKRYN